MKCKLIGLLLLSSISSCISVVPSFDEALYKHIEEVNSDIDKITAAVSKVYIEPPPFSKVEAFYVDAVANLDAAIVIADGRATHLKNKISERPAQLLKSALMLCDQALEMQLAAHRKAPINQQTIAAFATKDVCGIPKLMEYRLKGGK